MTSEGHRLLLVHSLRSWLIVLLTVLATKVRNYVAAVLLLDVILVNATAIDVVLRKCFEVGF